MQRQSLRAVIAALCAALGSSVALADPPTFEFLGRYTTGLADIEEELTSGETAAMRFGRLYVTNASDASLDIVNVWDPQNPSFIKRVDLSSYGSEVTSVAVSWWNLIAVAVKADVKTDPGKLVFLAPSGAVLAAATVGALPDMVTFTPDGLHALVANEGEPDCYTSDACVDPRGSISIVSVVPWWGRPTVRTVNFEGVALPPGVRVYGPGATPAEDLEPEFITVSDDSRKAYVTLQENNAIAEIDIRRARVNAVHALGFKDFNAPAEVETYEVANLPNIGTTIGNQTLKLGGFSGLFYEGMTGDGKLKFVTHTDRGPNAEPTGIRRPFLLPSFAPEIVRLTLDQDSGQVAITQRLPLKRADGSLLTGLPNTKLSSDANLPYNDELPVDLKDQELGLDPLGGDYEGIVVAGDGSFWLCDEYRPAIYHFDTAGKLLARHIPQGTHVAAGLPAPPAGTAGVYGIETLPAVLAQRRQNRGCEALVMQGGKLYAFVQSPIRNPVTTSNTTLNARQLVRIVELDPSTLATRQFLYRMDNAAAVAGDLDDTRADKIGDAAALPGRGFLVVERDDDAAPEDEIATISKKIYAFDLTGATPITPANDILYGGKSLDEMTNAELTAQGVTPVAKTLHLDLATTAYNTVEKVEGLALIDANTIAVINDNDFRVAAIVPNTADGTFTLAPGYVPEPVLLGLIRTPGLDASDRDNTINIRKWPVFGMYQPDAIAHYRTPAGDFLVTANEGDAREYPGLLEDVRARSRSALYPGVPEVGRDNELGRLSTTNTPPELSRPYAFGARSFSIWNATTGALVWDSGSELEVLTAAANPVYFNSDNAADAFDNRSDNKGPEPEGIDVGKIGGRYYAYVALERIGGVVVYDVTDPTAPEFIEYLSEREFGGTAIGPDAGPEIVKFLNALESPIGIPMLVVAHEITGTVSLYGLSNTKPWWRRHWSPTFRKRN